MVRPSADQLSLKRIVGQCIMPRLIPEKYAQDENYKEGIHSLVKAGVGGFCLFAGTPQEVLECTTALQREAGIPLLFSADYEWGLPMRLQGGTEYPHAFALGKGNRLDYTYRIGECIGREAAALGVHWNLAPVADIQNNPNNPVINIRSFGETPSLVAAHVEAYCQGLQHSKVLSCAKHFPGHGDTSIDSHSALPLIDRPRSTFEEREFVPFRKAVQAGCSSIMIGHLAVPSLFDDAPVATLSPTIVSILRHNFHFEGLIVTDAMDMGAVTSLPPGTWSPSLEALYAGNDIILLPPSPQKCMEEIFTALEQGKLSEEKLRLSAERILSAKEKVGLFSSAKSDEPITWTAHEHHESALLAAQAAIEIVSREGHTFTPLGKRHRIAGFALLADDKEIAPASMFFHYLSRIFDNECDFGFVSPEITKEQIEDFVRDTEGAEVVLFPIVSGGKTPETRETLRAAFAQLSAVASPIPIFLGSPYCADDFAAPISAFSYSFCEASIAAIVAKLVGTID